MPKYAQLPPEERARIYQLVVRLGEETTRRQAAEAKLEQVLPELARLNDLNCAYAQRIQELEGQLESQRAKRQCTQGSIGSSTERGAERVAEPSVELRAEQTPRPGLRGVSRRQQIDALRRDLLSRYTQRRNDSHIVIEESSIAGNSFFTQYDSVKKEKSGPKLQEAQAQLKQIHSEWSQEIARMAEVKERIRRKGDMPKDLSRTHTAREQLEERMRDRLESRDLCEVQTHRTEVKGARRPAEPAPSNLLELIDSLQL